MWTFQFALFNNIYVSSLDIVNSIYVRVFVRILHLAATSMGVKHEGKRCLRLFAGRVWVYADIL